MLIWLCNKVLGIKSPSQLYMAVMTEELTKMCDAMDASWDDPEDVES